MKAPRVLFISGSVGLGHVTRDVSIARALREAAPGIVIDWLAGDAARRVLAEALEPLLPEAELFTTGTAALEAASLGFALNLADPRPALRSFSRLRGLFALRRDAVTNVRLVKAVTDRIEYDLIVGDETFELALAFARNRNLKTAPFVLITDFIGVEAMASGWLEQQMVRTANRGWTALLDPARSPADRLLFVGERDDVPGGRLAPGQPSWRELLRGPVEFVGYVLPFDPADLADRSALRARLGYGSGPLVVCAIGGTAVGAPLLTLCAEAAPLVRRKITAARFVLVSGPRLPPSGIGVSEGVEVCAYVPRLHEHLGACDLAVVQGGSTTTLELTALRRPFLYFPLEEHFEQQLHVARRLRRHGAGVKMQYSATTAPLLADAICSHLGEGVAYPPIAVGGARRAAAVLAGMLPSGVRMPTS